MSESRDPPTTPPAGEALRLELVRIARGGHPLVAIDAVIPPAGVLTVMGPSGSGKSTLLDFIAGFLPPAFEAQGRVLLGKRNLTPLPPERRHLGLLFQDPLLFPHMSVSQNLLFAVPPEIRGRRRRCDVVTGALCDAGLDGFEGRDPATLSGGQRARVALLRVMLSRPCALLLDEPFSKLDAALRDQMRELVFTTARAHALPVLLVTHDPGDAKAAGGPVIELSPGGKGSPCDP